MIRTDHGIIRSTDADDAPFLYPFYYAELPRAALLDNKRETLMPTLSELRELFSRKDAVQGISYTLEDNSGQIVGFSTMRGINQESRFAEITLILAEDADYQSPLADDVFAFLSTRAFKALRLNKLVAHALSHESAWAGYLERHGFSKAGTLREVLHARGGWRDLDIFACFAAQSGDA